MRHAFFPIAAVLLLAGPAIAGSADDWAPANKTIAGRAVDREGRPVQVFVLGWRRPPSGHLQGPEIFAQAGPDGAFNATRVADAVFDLTAYAEGFGAADLLGVRAGTTDLLVTLERAARLICRFEVPPGNPWPEKAGWEVRRERSGTGVGPIALEPDGTFLVPVDPDAEHVVISPEGFMPCWIERPRPEPGATFERTLKLERLGTIAGNVVDEAGAPVAGARVTPEYTEEVRKRLRYWMDTPVETDAEGRFTLAGVAPGTVGIYVFAPNHGVLKADPIEVRPGGEVSDMILTVRRADR